MKRDFALEYKVLEALIESPEQWSTLEKLQRESGKSYYEVWFALLCLQDINCVELSQAVPGSKRWRITAAGFDRHAAVEEYRKSVIAELTEQRDALLNS